MMKHDRFSERLLYTANIVLADRRVAPLGTHYTDSEPTSLCSFSLCCMLIGEATNTNFIVFSLTWSGSNPWSTANH